MAHGESELSPPVVRPLTKDDPRHVGPYPLEGRIGAGGMGQVYLARTADDQSLAVKVVRAEFAGDSEFRMRFRQEVAAARRVRGVFTAEVIDADVDGPQPWLATAYVPGPSVQDFVAANGTMPARSVRSLAIGLAKALRGIHAAGVIHRDLKPSNVVLAADGPQVIDFGIARAVDATTITRTGVAVGSPHFMSPEQADGGSVTPASDVFALGAVIVFAATGRTPFGDGPTPAVLYRIVHGAPLLDGLPEDLRALAAACLNKDPGERPSPDDIIDWPLTADPTVATETVMAEHETRSVIQPPHSTLVDNAETHPRHRWERPLGIAAAGVILVLILVMFLIPKLTADNQRTSSSTTTPTGPPDVRRIAALTGDSGGTRLAFSPDGRTLAATAAGNVINLYDATTGALTAALSGHTAKITSMAMSPDGRILATGDTENWIRIWDLATRQQIKDVYIQPESNGSLTTLDVTPDGRVLTVTRWPNGITAVWDSTTNQVLGSFNAFDNSCPAAALSPDGATLANAACETAGHGVMLWQLTPEPTGVGTKSIGDTSVRDMAFSPDARILAVVEAFPGQPARVSLIATKRWSNDTFLVTEGSDVNAIAFSHDGRVLAAAGTTTALWDVTSHKRIAGTGHPIGTQLEPATSVALNADGHLLAVADDAGHVELWDVTNRVTTVKGTGTPTGTSTTTATPPPSAACTADC